MIEIYSKHHFLEQICSTESYYEYLPAKKDDVEY